MYIGGVGAVLLAKPQESFSILFPSAALPVQWIRVFGCLCVVFGWYYHCAALSTKAIARASFWYSLLSGNIMLSVALVALVCLDRAPKGLLALAAANLLGGLGPIGAAMLALPKTCQSILFPATQLPACWIRVLGCLLALLGWYGRHQSEETMLGHSFNADEFFHTTVSGRIILSLALAAIVLVDRAPKGLLLLAAVNSLGALTMMRALSLDSSTKSDRLIPDSRPKKVRARDTSCLRNPITSHIVLHIVQRTILTRTTY
eukprot:316919-Amphidinium_carterae.1